MYKRYSFALENPKFSNQYNGAAKEHMQNRICKGCNICHINTHELAIIYIYTHTFRLYNISVSEITIGVLALLHILDFRNRAILQEQENKQSLRN